MDVQKLLLLLVLMGSITAVNAQEAVKLSLGQYRITDGDDGYDFTPLSIKYTSQKYRGRIMLPYISDYQGQSGLGNMALKLSYLTQWRQTFIDFNYRQTLATADDKLTLPVKDNGLSIELSRYLLGGVGFVELGYTWRNKVKSNQAKRKNSIFYALGAIYPIKKGLSAGLILDHKPTALGQLNQSATVIAQYKINHNNRLGFSWAKGLTTTSPNGLFGLVWSHRF